MHARNWRTELRSHVESRAANALLGACTFTLSVHRLPVATLPRLENMREGNRQSVTTGGGHRTSYQVKQHGMPQFSPVVRGSAPQRNPDAEMLVLLGLRRWLEEQGRPYVLAVKSNEPFAVARRTVRGSAPQRNPDASSRKPTVSLLPVRASFVLNRPGPRRPRMLRQQPWSNNPWDRLSKQIRRRTGVVGTVSNQLEEREPGWRR